VSYSGPLSQQNSRPCPRIKVTGPVFGLFTSRTDECRPRSIPSPQPVQFGQQTDREMGQDLRWKCIVQDVLNISGADCLVIAGGRLGEAVAWRRVAGYWSMFGWDGESWRGCGTSWSRARGRAETCLVPGPRAVGTRARVPTVSGPVGPLASAPQCPMMLTNPLQQPRS